MSTPPNRYVQPELSDARVERLWGNVAERLQKRPANAWRWALLGTALAGVAAGGLLWVEARSASSIAGSEHSVLADA